MSAFTLNFTLQDILGAALAFCLFPLVILFPGYVTGWAMDLFDFKLRQPIVRLGIGLILSFAISPIVLDLTSSLFSVNYSLLTLGVFAAAFVVIILKGKLASTSETKRGAKAILWIGGIWAAFAILLLMDIQWKDQLYFSVASFDQTTRVSIIEAMTRTGVPPINPSYYPGHPVRLTFLYYFWYILGSMVDVIGGRYVDARAALNASSAWAGLGLMAGIALYLRQRNANNTESAWRSARVGIGLLAVSGLDALFFLLILISKAGNTLQFAILTWNNLQFSILTLLGTLIGYILWVPHHIAALIAGLSAVMLAQSARGKKASRRFAILTVAGLGFASALGLSVWVTLVFVLLWGIWIVLLFIQKRERGLIAPMIFAGIVALLLTGPFLIGMFQGEGGGGTGQFPIGFEIRAPVLLEPIVKEWSPIARSLILLAILPFSYLFEFGFFFIAGIYWTKIKGKEAIRSNPFYLVEIILLAIALFIGSCLRSSSTLIGTNDLGFRAWLPGQFILLVWGVDVAEALLFNKSDAMLVSIKPREALIIRNVLQALILIGVLTSTLDAVFLRIFWPAWAGIEFGQRTYSARLAYDYLRDNVPADVITQNNPLTALDRPSGLYGTHQMAISDRTSYGVSPDAFHKLVNEIEVLFTDENATDWQLTDRICQEHSIDVLIINDTDPIWSSLTSLKTQRPALYENAHYALYPCGDYAQNK